MTHTLHVTGLGKHLADMTIDGHDRQCVVLRPCSACTDIPDGNSTVRHGVTHDAIEGVWCIDTGMCGATATLDGVAAMNQIAVRRGVGDWPVEVTYLENGAWTVEDVTANNALDIIEKAIIAATNGGGSVNITRTDLMTVHRELLRYTT
ncbi:hypothetical protein [Aeromicrobium sp. 179-A 4D2 NHS]|uniref:hypothetical protein n=1 Tax=Aeromicrobium sp. 179-A 4D2 NHS TaxID=3142375 RepID=UPI00399F6EC0